jgi:hypothetical protein
LPPHPATYLVTPAIPLFPLPTSAHSASLRAAVCLFPFHSFAKKRKTHLPDSTTLIHSSKMRIPSNPLKTKGLFTLYEKTGGAEPQANFFYDLGRPPDVHDRFALTPISSGVSALCRAQQGWGVLTHTNTRLPRASRGNSNLFIDLLHSSTCPEVRRVHPEARRVYNPGVGLSRRSLAPLTSTTSTPAARSGVDETGRQQYSDIRLLFAMSITSCGEFQSNELAW